jgi:hypothetical protein
MHHQLKIHHSIQIPHLFLKHLNVIIAHQKIRHAAIALCIVNGQIMLVIY